MSSRHLSDSPVWIPQTDHILSLDGKTLLLCEPDEHEYPLQLSVMQAPSDGPDSGKFAIRDWQTDLSSVSFESKQHGGTIPTKVCTEWSAYLDESAVGQIAEAAEYCDFELRLNE